MLHRTAEEQKKPGLNVATTHTARTHCRNNVLSAALLEKAPELKENRMNRSKQ